MAAKDWGGSTAEPHISTAEPHINDIKEYLSKLEHDTDLVKEEEKNIIMNMVYYFRKYKLGEGEIKEVKREDVNIVLEGIITPDNKDPAVGVDSYLVGAARPSPETESSRSSSAHATQTTQQLSLNQDSWLQNPLDF
jgi:hypothetical protein